MNPGPYPFIARLIGWLLLPVWLAHTVWRSLRDGKLLFLQQRLGFAIPLLQESPKQQQEPNGEQSGTPKTVWVHATSVGEVITVLPLLRQLKNYHPELQFLLTTTTPTGKAVAVSGAADLGLADLRHAYLPIDYTFPVTRFIKRTKPHCVLIVETEIWPCLYRQCYKRNVPVAIINGRISEKTLRATRGLAAKTIAPALTSTLASVNRILARSESDAGSFNALLALYKPGPGVRATTSSSSSLAEKPPVIVCGNLKQLQQPAARSETGYVAESVNGTKAESITNSGTAEERTFNGRLICLLASTHDGEEIQLVKAWMSLKRKELFIVVPRHPERGKRILAQLRELGVESCLRSDEKNPPATTQVYIADTLGELRYFYEHAYAAFVGGSLVPVGGHNILEAAQAGCAIVVGPHMHNFNEEFSLLSEAGAIQQSDNANGVVTVLATLLDDRKKNVLQTQRAFHALNNQEAGSAQQILNNYLENLQSLFETPERK